jgi:hypothetical protein
MMAGPNDFQTITGAILDQTSDDTVIVAMLVGAGLESGWRIDAAGGGAFQITDAARPKPVNALTQGNTQIAADVKYMLPRYEAAVIVHAGDKESADKYANIAADAEKPKVPYQQSQGEAKVQSVYTTVRQNYGAPGATGRGNVKTIVGGNIGLGFLTPVAAFLSDLTDIRLWRSIGWIGLGLALLVLGLVIWLRKPIESAVGTAAKAAAI